MQRSDVSVTPDIMQLVKPEQHDGSGFCLEKKKKKSDQGPNNTLPTHIRAHTKRAVAHVFSSRDRKSSGALWLADFLSRPLKSNRP